MTDQKPMREEYVTVVLEYPDAASVPRIGAKTTDFKHSRVVRLQFSDALKELEEINTREDSRPDHLSWLEASNAELTRLRADNESLVAALKAAGEWLSGWASAEPFLTGIRAAIAQHEGTS